mgnify:CR=1 FL=1
MSACLLLAVLTGVSLIGVFRGQSDCGCFGQLKVHPGITAAINLVTLGLLMVFRPAVKWAENRGTVAGVVALAVVAGGLVWIANGPVGEKLLVKWQGRTVALRSSVIDAGEETVGTVKRLPVTVTNSSSRDVRLIGGSVSCSCTTTQSLPVTVPADAMHSFAAGHNQVAWRFRVTARVLGVLPYEETFPAVVVPGGS